MRPDGAGGRSAAQIVDAVGATGLLQSGGPFLVMASAGRDSGCLVDLVARAVGAGAVHVLHVDHGLRGPTDSEADAAAVREWCDALGVPLTVLAADPGDGIAGNVHAWARGERRRLAAQVAGETGAQRILVAHTRTDLVETALGRLATQPGRRALLSMRASEGELARPLLAAGVTREETAAYCQEREISWREDPSNTDRAYARARIRHDVLPVLRSLNPQAEDAIARTLTELAEESAALAAIVDAELEGGRVSAGEAGLAGEAGFAGETGLAGEAGSGSSVSIERLAALPPALARLVLRELCERALGRPCPRATSRLDDVLALGHAAERQGTGSLDIGDGARIELRHGLIRCVLSSGPAAPR